MYREKKDMFTRLNVDGLIIGNISCGNRNSIIPKQKPTFLTFQRAYYYVTLSIGNMAINVYYMFVYFCVNQYSGMSNKMETHSTHTQKTD